jgi:peptidyl-prolyl cis-trans isomerase B (cyclophilin B)
MAWLRAGAWVLAGLLVALGQTGCTQQGSQVSSGETSDAPGVEIANAATSSPPAAAGDSRLTQSFAEATRREPPADWPRPPDTTATGKSVGKLYTDVEHLWKEISFTTPQGKRLKYSATLETDLGAVTIALRPDLAPNHVRNFVALTRVGYYNGLVFERIIHQVSDPNVEKGVTLDLIEGGGPLGLTDPGYDSIGYWLKAEVQSGARHEEGTVGACRGEEMDTAACKFYIIIGKPPASLDGNYTVFGKVVRGLDVVRKIHQQSVVENEQDGGYHRPEKPVVIRKVAVHTQEEDIAVASKDRY